MGIKIIKHPRKSMFFDRPSTWIKEGYNALSDVIKDSYDGAEVCELVGRNFLHKLSFIVDKECIGVIEMMYSKQRQQPKA